MADVARYDFTYQEVVESLLKHQGIKEGIWQLGVEFGFAASNIASDETGSDLKPAGILSINRLILVKAEALSNLAVDAASLVRVTKKKSGS